MATADFIEMETIYARASCLTIFVCVRNEEQKQVLYVCLFYNVFCIMRLFYILCNLSDEKNINVNYNAM